MQWIIFNQEELCLYIVHYSNHFNIGPIFEVQKGKKYPEKKNRNQTFLSKCTSTHSFSGGGFTKARESERKSL